jgi:hypothetical protein
MTDRGLPCGLGLGLAVLWIGIATSDLHAADRPLPQEVDFNGDIRHILSDNCYQCHGPDKNQRKAHFRLDTRDGLFSSHDDIHIIVPGRPDQSELFRRITAPDAAERMPNQKSGKALTARQVALIQKWIKQGAQWKGHWAYIKPTRPELPAADGHGQSTALEQVKNIIDRFVLAKLSDAELRPSPEADRVTLIRRLSFDLTGLPPTSAEVDAFVNDRRPEAYENLVDRLLTSPHYGERMAMYWLDLVRYADSIGYHSDNPMSVSPYRDYVIKAFNDNKRFDQFTVEQLAGDLLPGTTVWQKVASGYNRLLQTTEEGGSQAKEYEAKYAADRVRNVSSVWLGATMGCCQCHDHKFDPFTMKDFYSLAAFFADVQEAAVGRREAGMLLPTSEQAAALKKLDDGLASLQQVLNTPTPALAASQAKWEEALRLTDLRKLPKNLPAILLVEPAKRTAGQNNELAAQYRTIAPELQKARDQLADLKRQRDALDKTIPKCLVAVSGPPRVVRILPRGNWLDSSGEVVSPAVPKFMGHLQSQAPRATRLDLAHWLVARDNPLPARVLTNRLWKLFFGHGLSRSLEDFGSQGEWPTHPELLDWLAVEFMDSGWDVKHMVKLMVMSGTYRQTSQVRPDLKEKDPYNRLYARQSRFRLDAEMVRDNALAVSGLLSPHIGGASVKPYQPAGYWSALNFPTREWQNDQGEQLYRRGLYTHWQRSFLHPSLLAFDAPTREECTVDRPRSNIPQQALALLNDPTYVEAARVFAERIFKEGGVGVHDRLNWAFRCTLSRLPTDDERKTLTELYAKHLQEYVLNESCAQKLLTAGAHPSPKDTDIAELAAWTSVARVLLNLHETITRS